jgi:hypothetical protein
MHTAQSTSQHEKKRRRIKRALFEEERSIASVARKIERSRTAVSQAINHGRFPLVLKKVLREVGVK